MFSFAVLYSSLRLLRLVVVCPFELVFCNVIILGYIVCNVYSGCFSLLIFQLLRLVVVTLWCPKFLLVLLFCRALREINF